MHSEGIGYTLIDRRETCLVRLITGTLHFAQPNASNGLVDSENDETVQINYDPYTESLAE